MDERGDSERDETPNVSTNEMLKTKSAPESKPKDAGDGGNRAKREISKKRHSLPHKDKLNMMVSSEGGGDHEYVPVIAYTVFARAHNNTRSIHTPRSAFANEYDEMRLKLQEMRQSRYYSHTKHRCVSILKIRLFILIFCCYSGLSRLQFLGNSKRKKWGRWSTGKRWG